VNVHLTNIAADAAHYLRADKRRAKPFVEFAESHADDAGKLRRMLSDARHRYAHAGHDELAEAMDELLRRLAGLSRSKPQD
jgi:hypothetical protein